MEIARFAAAAVAVVGNADARARRFRRRFAGLA